MNNKPRILMIFPGPKYNIGHAFRERCEYLSKEFEGTIMTSGPSRVDKVFSGFNVTCFRDPFGKSMVSTVAFLLFGFLILVKARFFKNKYDLIITYDPLRTGLIGLILAKLTATKLVVEVNGDYSNDWVYSDINNRFRRWLKKHLMILTEDLVLGRSDGIKLLFKSQITGFNYNKDAIVRVFPDYVQATDFRDLGESQEVLFVGFPLGIKGVDLLIESFNSISNRYSDWNLKILGYFPDKSALQSLIGENQNIEIHDPVDPSEMPAHIGKCGIFVLPSRTEAMGRVLIEAMAAGKPRVGSRVGGIPTVINDEVDGLLFHSEDVDDLAKKLAILIENPEYRKKLGENGKQRYLKEFLPKHYFKELEDFYKSVIYKS